MTIIICGLGRFGLRLTQLLREQNIPVTVITAENTPEDQLRRAKEQGAVIILGDFRRESIREQAKIATARAVLIVTSEDTINLEVALDVRQEAPSVPIILRYSSEKLATRLEQDFGIHAVLSPPVIAAEHFAEAALQSPATSTRRVLHLPNLSVIPREMRGVLSVLLGLYCVGVALFHFTMGWSWLDSAYFTATVLTTVGFGDYNLQNAPPPVKLFGILLMFGGVTLVALLVSFLTNYVLSGAATQARVLRQTARMRDHVIVCGLGSVGGAVVSKLLEQGVSVVAIDATPEDEYFRETAIKIPVLVGDATHAEILRQAGIHHARALISATSSDAVNLEIALMTQSLIELGEETRPSRPLRLVLRCFDPDLARRIHALSEGYTVLSSAEIAAPVFIDRALDNAK
jgi:Trk K+ transport system NAD-binding subunit